MEARWLDRRSAAEVMGLDPDEFKRLAKMPGFPIPSDYLGPKCLRWDRQAISKWFASLARLYIATGNTVEVCPMRSPICPLHQPRRAPR